jgi:PKD repeat protein
MILLFTTCYKEEIIDIEADFEVEVINNDYSVPVEISLINNSNGADRYLWIFEGGIPETSTLKQPENVWYKQAGTYTIKLECFNKFHSVTKEYSLQMDSAIRVEFETHIRTNAFVPLLLEIENKSSGSSFYQWQFEGGKPESSTEKNPPLILYENPGEYTIRLITGNERETKEFVRSIQALPRLEADFTANYSFEDEDREAPAVILLESRTTSVLYYKWEAPGGKIENDTAPQTSVYFEQPGSYTISLTVNNDKETKLIRKDMELFPNKNLLSMTDVRIGINSSKEDGPFFSGYLRRTLKENEINEDNGYRIDFVFFGLNEHFNYCRFLSPDSADIFTFKPVPQAIKTYIVNDLEGTSLNFTASIFDSMENDMPLRSLNIKSFDSGNLFFELNTFPRLILFETGDGRKGALKIKGKTVAGINSYIEADIKMQKEDVKNN